MTKGMVVKRLMIGNNQLRYVVKDGRLFMAVTDMAKCCGMSYGFVDSAYRSKVSARNKFSMRDEIGTSSFDKMISISGVAQIHIDGHYETKARIESLIENIKDLDPLYNDMDASEILYGTSYSAAPEVNEFEHITQEDEVAQEETEVNEEMEIKEKEEVKEIPNIQSPIIQPQDPIVQPQLIAQHNMMDVEIFRSTVRSYEEKIDEIKRRIREIYPDIIFDANNLPISIKSPIKITTEPVNLTPVVKPVVAEPVKPIVEEEVIMPEVESSLDDINSELYKDFSFVYKDGISTTTISNFGSVRFIRHNNSVMLLMNDIIKTCNLGKNYLYVAMDKVQEENKYIPSKQMIIYKSSRTKASKLHFVNYNGFEDIKKSSSWGGIKDHLDNIMLGILELEEKTAKA